MTFNYSESDANSLAPTWNARRVHSLVWEPGCDVAAALSSLDSQLTEADDLDSAAVVVLPSRETSHAAALTRHHFAPLVVVASRPHGRASPPGSPDVVVEPLSPADVAVATDLNVETVRYDTQFGVVTERENTAELLRAHIATLPDRAEECAWLAWVDGVPAGMLYVDFPPHSDWMSRYTSARPLGYLGHLGVREDLRGRGVGNALVAHAHQVLDEAGIAETLLHHSLPNPRSTPFWYSHGYQPVWTMWVRRPALRSPAT